MGRDDSVQPSASDLSVRLEAIAGLDEEGFRTRPDASEWSTAEVLAHLLATEGNFRQEALSLRHPRRGKVTIAWLFQQAAEHEEEHAAQVQALRARPAAPTR